MSTKEFNHPALGDVYQTLNDIEELEKLLNGAKDALIRNIMDLPSKIGDNEDLQDAIVHHLYWFDERIPSATLRDAFQVKIAAHAKKNANEKILRSASLEFICPRCEKTHEIEVTSRTKLQSELRHQQIHGVSKVCPDCSKQEIAQHSQSGERYLQELAQKRQELHTMPYREYLQTPEWQEKRKSAMKRAGFRCQVCNAYGVRLNVHHRTYERRGYENNHDLIVLCANCHQIFHDNGSLASDE